MSPAGNGLAARVTTWICTESPGASVPSAQVYVTLSADVQAALSADTNVSPAGSVSVMVTSVASMGVVLVAVTVYGTWAPGTIPVTLDTLEIATWGCSGTVTVELHSGAPGPSTGQFDPGAVTDAVFGTAPPASSASAGNGLAARVTTLMTTVAPTARSPRSQVRVTESADVQPRLSVDTRVRPAGRMSTSVTPGTGTGSVLVTVSWNGTWAPGTMAVAVVVFATATWGWSGVATVELHAAAGGLAPAGQFELGELTVAVFGTVPSGAVPGNGSAATVTTPTVAVPPAATVPSAQTIVTRSPDEHPADDTNVSPAGSVSVMTTFVAAAADVF